MIEKRFFRSVFLSLTAIMLCFLLSGCGFYELLGIDMHDYDTEESLNTLALDGSVANGILNLLPMLFQNTPYLGEFDSPAEAAKLYRDGILCSILASNYAKYNANNDLIDKTRALYPTLEITTVIPAVDFESTAYRCFGGAASVSNASTPLFIYLERVDAYISVGIGVDNSAEVTLTELYETENTYVCRFFAEMNGERSDSYRLLLMKRDDGTFYMRKLTAVYRQNSRNAL